MKEVNMAQLLNRMQTDAVLAQNKTLLNAATEASGAAPDFSSLLKQSVDKVNALQKQSGALGKAFELGDPNVSLAEVMLAKQKSGVAFQSVLQVRNKLVEAYKQIMNMSV
ncbi:MAG: flagellar hook-basal body complex protein FliE [Gammaproteobacteria bacterium]|nr:flagellar hook-basal body complex protein FliE [Gammaproteobacteria bacterium]